MLTLALLMLTLVLKINHIITSTLLIFYSEAVHADFKKVWVHFKRSIGHPDHGKQLLGAVVRYNSRHLMLH